jgi:hypothetical protein
MAPSDEGAVSEADWGRDRKKFRIIVNFSSSLTFSGILSLRHGFAVPPPSSEGGFSLCPPNSPINPYLPEKSPCHFSAGENVSKRIKRKIPTVCVAFAGEHGRNA